MSYVPKPQFLPRIGSPWLGLSSNSARMNPMASRHLFKPLPALLEPAFGPKSQKKLKNSQNILTNSRSTTPAADINPNIC